MSSNPPGGPSPPEPGSSLGYPQQGQPNPQGYPQPWGYPPAYPQQHGYPRPVGYPGQQPGYPQAYPQQPGYPQAYPPGYPAGPQPGARPGIITAASVLAFVQAGIVLFSGVSTLGGASGLRGFGLTGGTGVANVLAMLSIAAMISGGLLIAGGVQLFKRKPLLLLTGAGMSLIVSLWWMVQTDFNWLILTWALILAVMPILSIAFTLNRTAQAWIRSTDR